MPEKAAFFHFYSAFCFIPREISGLSALLRKMQIRCLYRWRFCFRSGFRIAWARVITLRVEIARKQLPIAGGAYDSRISSVRVSRIAAGTIIVSGRIGL